MSSQIGRVLFFFLTQQSHHICVIAVDVETRSLIARVLRVIIQEDELCFPPDIYAAGRL